MQPNSISHRLFAAALSQGVPATPKRSARSAKVPVKAAVKVSPVLNAAARKIGNWSWSGWQHTTI